MAVLVLTAGLTAAGLTDSKAQSIAAQRAALDFITDTGINRPYKYPTIPLRSWQIFNTTDAWLRHQYIQFSINLYDSAIASIGSGSLNFANANLSATGTRKHNWKGYSLEIDSTDIFTITGHDNTKFLTHNSAAKVLWVGDSTNLSGISVNYAGGAALVGINNSYSLPAFYGAAGYKLQANGPGLTSWAADKSKPVANYDTLAVHAACTVLSYSVPSDGNYSVDCNINISAIVTDIAKITISWVDQNSNPQIVNITSLTATGFYYISPVPVRAKSGSAITIAVALTTGGGSITYSSQAYIYNR